MRAIERTAGWGAQLLEGEAASATQVRSALGEVQLLHYAGHGRFSGRDGWDSALPLAAGGQLSMGDVLALDRVPRLVVLSGCETAREAGDTPLVSLGLAHAFLARGAAAVIASVRPIKDTLGLAIAEGLYAQGSAGVVDLAGRLRAAQLRLYRARPTHDWASYRAILR